MIHQLKQVFPNLTKITNSDSHYQFTYNDQNYGIPYSDLTDESIQLLKLLLSPINLDEQSINWLSFINGETDKAPEQVSQFRLFIVINSDPIEDLLLVQKSLNDVFGKKLIYFPMGKSELILLESIEPAEDIIDISPLVDVLSSDLEMNLRVFESSLYSDVGELPYLFNKIKKISHSCFQFTNKKFIHQNQALVYYLMQQLSDDEKLVFTDSILKETANDVELLNTIETVIKCQLNITLASKLLFMHRNTVQNRIERFQKITNCNLHDFEDSQNVYMAIQYAK
uniref:PucR family transcriptional regulator n=1 Tax=uncultured Allobacillus sp. TaxID=1638025 RepID=UPI002594DBCA|nr:helix-turn-helix domain-containing protein [uncultured Allobacillus sp.]